MTEPVIRSYFDEATFTVSYLVWDPDSGEAAVIDSVLDFDPKSGRTGTDSADRIVSDIRSEGLKLCWILETHVHADHLTAARYLQRHLGGRICIGEKVPLVQETFRKVFNLDEEDAADGGQFDRLLAEGEVLALGGHEISVLSVPGHTPACIAYRIGDACFVGDTMFMPDYGSARCDFPGGNARQLYHSVMKILSLPPETRLYLCHDYKAPGRDEYAWETTVAEQRARNLHLNDSVGEEEFVRIRQERDKGLSMPLLILPAVQVNMAAGRFPEPEENGVSYLKIPVDLM